MNYPDLFNYGYKICRELGQNRAAGQVTYLATEINTNKQVVIKQFQFANVGSTWSEYDVYQQEIEVLRRLEHPQIPRYLDSFSTATGLCMITEYKHAPSLAIRKKWAPTPKQVKQIAIQCLEILYYLQNQIPPIIHRDLKPENILLDQQMKVILVDFGFARMGVGQVAVSSVVKGTLGFMPPEQIFNRQLNPASDLYSLGVTLICLLTNTKSTEVGKLIDEKGKLNFASKLPHLTQNFLDWLAKMVEPDSKNRYSNAQEALSALLPLQVTLPPRKKSQATIIKILGLIGSVTILSIFILVRKFIFPQPVQIFSPQEVFSPLVLVQLNPQTQENLNKISLNSGRVYFQVNFSNLSKPKYQTLCQLFDGDGNRSNLQNIRTT